MIDFPKQPVSKNVIKAFLSISIVFLAIWSASGLEISLERLAKAPQLTWILISALFPIDLSQEALDRIIPKVFESLYIAWIGTVIGALFSFPIARVPVSAPSPVIGRNINANINSGKALITFNICFIM